MSITSSEQHTYADRPRYFTNAHNTRVYLAGPMRGIPKFNFPAFEKAAKHLRQLGFTVWSPAENDVEKDGLDVNQISDFSNAPKTISHYMERDLPEVCRADVIALLHGWEKSTGARLELHVARQCGKTVIDAMTARIMPDAELDDVPGIVDKSHLSIGAHKSGRSVGIGGAPNRAVLPNSAEHRKQYPVASGCLDYFPDAIIAIANLSHVGNEQHNPGKPLHWDRSKSGDESDTMIRHFLQRGGRDNDGVRHTAKMAWRALALLQKEIESEL